LTRSLEKILAQGKFRCQIGQLPTEIWIV